MKQLGFADISNDVIIDLPNHPGYVGVGYIHTYYQEPDKQPTKTELGEFGDIVVRIRVVERKRKE